MRPRLPVKPTMRIGDRPKREVSEDVRARRGEAASLRRSTMYELPQEKSSSVAEQLAMRRRTAAERPRVQTIGRATWSGDGTRTKVDVREAHVLNDPLALVDGEG